MSGPPKQIEAIATRITRAEAAQLMAFPIGSNRSEKARVLLRFALEHWAEAVAWFELNDGEHVDGFNPAP